MAEDTREALLIWLKAELHGEDAHARLDAMTLAALRREKAHLAPIKAEMDAKGRLEVMWEREGFPA